MDNYNQLLEKISRLGKVAVEEVERKVEAKRAKLSGLVSKEGAAQIVAAELGINFERERLKINELAQGMKRANVVGKVIEVFPVRSYNKNGREGKVGKLLLADEGSNAQVVLWDTNHIALLEKGEIKAGDVLEISNAMVRNGELHLSSFADVKKSKETMDDIKVDRSLSFKKLKDAKVGDKMKARAWILQSFEPRYFEVCPECGKKAMDSQCIAHGKIEAKKRAILSIVIDDGSESMRCAVFGDTIKELGLTEEEIFSLEKFAEKKESILGEEKLFTGSVRSNSLYNTIDFNVEKVENVSVDEVIKELEAR